LKLPVVERVETLIEGAPASRRVGGEPSDQISARQWLKAAGMTPGVWVGIAGYILMVAASLLPWYNVSARVPSVQGFADMTSIIQFDGVNGLYVHPLLKEGLGLGVPAIGFPFAILFLFSALMKIRKIIRSNQHKMRAATLTRSSFLILIPLIITLAAIMTLPNFVPSSAPVEAQNLAHAVAAQPFGGSSHFTFDAPQTGLEGGDLQWGFGPAIYVMIAAALLMNVGSQLEMRVYRRLTKEVAVEAAENRQAP
jgi:hypothetical protein